MRPHHPPEEWINRRVAADDIEPVSPLYHRTLTNLPDEWIDPETPVDKLEPDAMATIQRAARYSQMKCVYLLNAAFKHIEGALLKRGATLQSVAVAFYQPAYALGLNLCEEISMTKRANLWGVERASISKGATAFCTANDLPPSFYMKDEMSQTSYREARVASIKRCNTTNLSAA